MNWAEFAAAAPELMPRVWAPFDAERHAIMATVRADGSPRVSGIEPKVFDGELWLGFMPNSWKARDLRRDPRFAMHCSSTLERMQDMGDAKISGTAEFVDDPAKRKRYAAWLKEHIDFDPGNEFDLFRAELTEATLTTTGGDELVVETWRPVDGVTVRRRQ
jgi:hypothetical protein